MSEDDHCISCKAPTRSDIPWVFFSCGHFSCCKWTDTCTCGLGTVLPDISLQSNETLKHMFASVESARNSNPLQYQEGVESLKGYLATLSNQYFPSQENSTERRPADAESYECAANAAVWTCKFCSYQYNIRELESCQRCKAARLETQNSSKPASAATLEEEKPGEIDQKLSALSSKKQFWRCEKCNYNTNRAGDTHCQRCKEQKEERKVQDFTVRRRQSAWVCVCGSENKGNNDTCSRCLEYRKAVGGKGGCGQDGGSAGVGGSTGSESSSTDCEKPSPSVDFPPSAVPSSEGQSLSQSGIKPVQKDSSNAVTVRPVDRKAPVGQWKCQNCGFAANMATAAKCYTCQMGRGAKGKK